LEERLYEEALVELESGHLRVGLWAKALASSDGDEQKARGLYLKYRVQAMNDEAEIAEGFAEHMQDEALRKAAQEKLRQDKERATQTHISNYCPLNEFSLHMNIPEDKLIQLIRKGFYKGRLFDNKWYVHKSEVNPAQ